MIFGGLKFQLSGLWLDLGWTPAGLWVDSGWTPGKVCMVLGKNGMICNELGGSGWLGCDLVNSRKLG